MGWINNLVMAAIIGGLSFGAYHSYSVEKAEKQAFESARQAALDAPRSFS